MSESPKECHGAIIAVGSHCPVCGRGNYICSLCEKPIGPGEEYHPTMQPFHVLCRRRKNEGRCLRCGQYATICGHDLSPKERWKRVSIDKSSLRP